MSHSTHSLSRRARLYIAVVIAAGLAITAYSALRLYVEPRPPHWLILAALTLLTGTFSVKLPALRVRISVSEAFVLTSVLMFGTDVGVAIVALDALVMSFWMAADNRSRVRTLFSLSAVAIAIWCSSHAFFAMLGSSKTPLEHIRLTELAAPLLLLAGLYFLVNSWLVAFALAAERDQSVTSLWIENFPWLSLNYFGGASVAALLVAYTRSVDLGALGIILPLLVISYLTYRTSLGRVDDAQRHVDQVNTLYMSAIETLAMAVDAKDQITHGHIRRVQIYAIELAKRLGVKDPQQLQAIETAALLHDMGKLAIPEHILNKPGKLSNGEFEIMKRHSDIGADLLSSIPFPYPVVPIVRHHHENWDGSGYPTGISGTDIPLGARILSVVDCFDALTSDRPYRPRLSNSAAFAILRERRASMYDPLVVDTFIASYENIAPAAIRAGEEARTLVPSKSSLDLDKASAFDEIYASSNDGRALLEVRRSLSMAATPRDAISAVFPTFRQITPAHVVAFYALDAERDVLRCAYAVGGCEGLLIDFEIPNGQRASGWAAANLTSVMNSAASLDLGNVADLTHPPLRSTLCVPVRDDNTLLGVLALYSPSDAPFVDRHRYLTEQIATFLVTSLRRPKHRSVVSFRDQSRAHFRPQGQ